MSDTQRQDLARKPRFSLTALLTFVVFVCLILGWWADRTRLNADRTRLQRELARSTEIARFAKRELFEQLQDSGIGTSASRFPHLQMFADDTFDETRLTYLWDRLAPQHHGKSCVGYYFETAEINEGDAGFYVLTVDGGIVALQILTLPW